MQLDDAGFAGWGYNLRAAVPGHNTRHWAGVERDRITLQRYEFPGEIRSVIPWSRPTFCWLTQANPYAG